jgi:hypothetical protein
LLIVVAFDRGEPVAPRGIVIGVHAVMNELIRVPKKLSIGALPQQFALRLINWTNCGGLQDVAVVAGGILATADALLIVKRRSGLG